MTYARTRFPSADYIYYADSDHVPYGTKKREEITLYSDTAVDYLVSHGADAVVVACNTATSMAIDYLRAKYSVPIVGMEPAVKPASEIHSNEKILVCATPVTIAGEKLHNLIDKNYNSATQPTLVATPDLVSFAENSVFDTETICNYLGTVIDKKESYAAVVLGCTHFGYFRDSFREFFGEIDIFDGTEGTVNRLFSLLCENNKYIESDGDGSITYVRSGRIVTEQDELTRFEELADRIVKYYK
ncbi:MAG: glutamate racemase [Ruminococcaceae bacterium]|nr:glutamate racemase [Oscillospiraceae bacterium]